MTNRPRASGIWLSLVLSPPSPHLFECKCFAADVLIKDRTLRPTQRSSLLSPLNFSNPITFLFRDHIFTDIRMTFVYFRVEDEVGTIIQFVEGFGDGREGGYASVCYLFCPDW